MSVDALELAEIRGWIVHVGGIHDGEDEYEMDILVDLGWTATPDPRITPINTVDVLAKVLSPVNVAAMGYPAVTPARPPAAPSAKSYADGGVGSMLRGDVATFGGTYAPIIHIEVDGCGQGRPCNPFPATSAPPGWCLDFKGIHWPFDVWAFKEKDPSQPKDYVRAIGTIWHDSAHAFDRKHPHPANDCWETVRPSVGWTEMHGVDYMEKLAAPANPHVLAGYAMCMNHRTQKATVDDTFAIGAAPSPGAKLVVASRHFGTSSANTMIEYSHLGGASRDDPNFQRATPFYDSATGRWSVHYNVSAAITALDGTWLDELVDVYWNTCPVGQCPAASSGSCVATAFDSDPENCGDCAHHCELPINGNGAPSCQHGACTFSCASGYYPAKNGCTTQCAPTTCAAQGKTCGVIDDGCGKQVSCGTCCTPSGCGARCGKVSDGCGGTLDCGACSCAPQKCARGFMWDVDTCKCIRSN